MSCANGISNQCSIVWVSETKGKVLIESHFRIFKVLLDDIRVHTLTLINLHVPFCFPGFKYPDRKIIVQGIIHSFILITFGHLNYDHPFIGCDIFYIYTIVFRSRTFSANILHVPTFCADTLHIDKQHIRHALEHNTRSSIHGVSHIQQSVRNIACVLKNSVRTKKTACTTETSRERTLYLM